MMQEKIWGGVGGGRQGSEDRAHLYRGVSELSNSAATQLRCYQGHWVKHRMEVGWAHSRLMLAPEKN